MKSSTSKSLVLLLFVLLCGAAFAQSVSGGSSLQAPYNNTVTMQEHPAHATVADLSVEQNLLGTSGSTSAKGELPLWEVYTHLKPQPSLGEIARHYRAEKALAAKATTVYTK